MKSFLIMVLTTALVAAACYTRPGRRELVFFLLDTQAQEENRTPRKKDIENADRFARNVTIKDRWLWVDAEVDGKLVYTGAFAHWFERKETEAKGEKTESASIVDIARVLGKL